MKDLIIIGSGGLGRETAFTAERINAAEPQWNILGFIDDNPDLRGRTADGYEILGTSEAVKEYPDAYYICAIGSAAVRKHVVEKIKNIFPVKFATLIDPAAVCSRERIQIGEGTIICANTYVTLDIEIGCHVYIGANSTVGHDARIKDFVTLYPGVNLSGNTRVGEESELGTGSKVIQGLCIGSNTIVGAGAVVIRNIPPFCTAVGVPAKPVKTDINNI